MTNFNQELLRSSPALLALLGIVDYLQTSPPAFKSVKAGDQSVTSTALTLVTWATSAAIDTVSGWDGTSHKYTIPAGAGGTWAAYAALSWSVQGDQNLLAVQIRYNTTVISAGQINAGGISNNILPTMTLFTATVGADIEVYGTNASANDTITDVDSQTQFLGVRLGP